MHNIFKQLEIKMTKEQYFTLKQELKDLALYIKVTKHNSRCNATNKRKPILTEKLNPQICCGLLMAIFTYRHKHIVISLMRGKTREQIEKPRENNLPNEKYIKELLEQYATVEQTICIGS
jgi:hypothetical protein